MERFRSLAARRQPSVLVLDPDEAVAGAVGTILRWADFEVHEATTPCAAMEMLRQRYGQMDLLMTEIMLANTSGPVFVEKVLAQWPWIPVLYMSGCFDRADVQRYGWCEPERFIPKPFEAQALLDTVQHTLNAC